MSIIHMTSIHSVIACEQIKSTNKIREVSLGELGSLVWYTGLWMFTIGPVNPTTKDTPGEYHSPLTLHSPEIAVKIADHLHHNHCSIEWLVIRSKINIKHCSEKFQIERNVGQAPRWMLSNTASCSEYFSYYGMVLY